ncbi:MAG: HAD-IA family hydrolase [Bacilli bacterium]
MIKVIAFDLVGVLITEKDIILNDTEEKIERLFGANESDEDYINQAELITNENIIDITKNIINKLYVVKDKDIFRKIKEKYTVKIIIATNHVFINKDYIVNNMEIKNIDDIIISATINKVKPNKDFYEYILDKYKIKNNELLFIDDNIENINAAASMNINTIKVNKDTDILLSIKKYME